MSASSAVRLCDPYMWEDPRYIFRMPKDKVFCASEAVNKICFVYIVSIIVGVFITYMLKASGAILVSGLAATVYLIPTFQALRSIYALREETKKSAATVEEAFESLPDKEPCPSEEVNAKNPFNNIMVDEYKYAPTRDAAPDITSNDSKTALDSFFRVQWSSDPTDVFGKSQDQRMFVTQPITTIPNDQGSYQNWLYKIPGKTCKEGNAEACYGGTNGAAIPWLNL